MRFVIFTHSLRSDWNHGHVHFLRGVVRTLITEGHEVIVMEPRRGWSAENLARDHGDGALDAYAGAYPLLPPVVRLYDGWSRSVERTVRSADVVIVQEWTDPELIRTIGKVRLDDGGFRLYFHDAHHRSVTDPRAFDGLGLHRYDAVLGFGEPIRERYLEEGWVGRAYSWHEAADVEVFRPRAATGPRKDIVWIGNWGDEERTDEFRRLFLGPARDLGLSGTVHGVRYPEMGIQAVRDAGLDHAGYLPNHRVADVYAHHDMTLHLPRKAYRTALPGVPTIRMFEALACGIALVSAPWEDAEKMFRQGRDFLMVHDEEEMTEALRALRDDPELRAALGQSGLEQVRNHHTCAHRVNELMQIDQNVRGGLYPVDRRASDRSSSASGPKIAFFGSSLVSSYWNGAATYYRGLLRALADLGCDITFYEPDAYDRQANRDIADPDWARVVVYPADGTQGVDKALEAARGADVVVKASGVGVHDAYLERRVLDLQSAETQVVYWDVDAPATLDRMQGDPRDPLRALIPHYDLVCTYGGGPPVIEAYESLGARRCVPIYNAVDAETHHPVEPDPRYEADLAFLGNRLPDREKRVDHFFLRPAQARPHKRFTLGGSGWDDKELPSNVRRCGHVPTSQHNAFNCSARMVLNVNRDSMARYGWSPATRVFEAAGAGACIITDAFEGVESFFEPGREILVAETGADVVEFVDRLDPETAARIGTRARNKVLEAHTYMHRAKEVMRLLKVPQKELVLR